MAHNKFSNLRLINFEDRPRRYQRSTSTENKIPVEEPLNLDALTKSIITILRLIGIDVISFPNPAEGYSILGYDDFYGIISKDYQGTINRIILQ